MLNRLIKFSIYNRFIILILSVLVLVAGVVSLIHSDVDIFPDLNAPTVTVMTEAPGLAPEEVEQQVTFPIETAVNGAAGVRRVRSTSASGYSVVNIEFDWGMDVNVARQTVSERISGVATSFPLGVGEPILGPQSSILGEVLIVGLTADSTSMADLRSIADRVIRPRLLSIRGVAQVTVIGGDVQELQVKISTPAMRRYNVTLNEVLSSCEQMTQNAVGGIVNDYGNEYMIRGLLSTKSYEDIGETVVKSDVNGIVTLSDIATVEMDCESPRIGMASERCKQAVLITVTKQPKVGTIELNKTLISELDELHPTLPDDITISTDIFSQSTFIENSISNLRQSLCEGALFVIVVLFLFLMNIRTTLISVVAIPMSILITVIVLNLLHININTMTLGGIAIAIGSLVDDAIVDVENVYKQLHINDLKPALLRRPVNDVIFEASKDVRMPVFNSSLIIIASFLPLFFLSGIEGRMLIPLGISFIVALLSSTVIALTLTPALCCYMLGKGNKEEVRSKESWITSRIKRLYEFFLKVSFVHKKVVIVLTSALFVVSIGLFLTLGRSFLPNFNEGSFTINISTLPGISIEESDKIGRVAEELILSVPEIQTVARKTGRAELDEHALGSNVSEIEAPYKLTNRSRSDVSQDLREKLGRLPGCNIEVGQPISHRIDAMLSGTEAQIAIKLFGENLNVLQSKGAEIKNAIKGIDGIVDVNIEQQMGRPQIDIKPRRMMLSRYGITAAEFSQFITTAFKGTTVSHIYDKGFPYNLVVKIDPDEYNSIDALGDVLIDSNEGKIPLRYVCDILSTTGPNVINREDVNRRIIISANVEDRDLKSVVREIHDVISTKVKLPQGYMIKIGGQFESEASASRILLFMSILSLLIIFTLLYFEFKDVKQTLVILVNMPLAIIGGVMILAITGSDLNIPAIIGFISLMGISTRNGMLLLNRYNQLRAEGTSINECVMRGSTDRVIPILMTALTSTLALIPLALRGDEAGNEIQAPMAIVILGGLVTSTLLNIFIVPIIYSKLKNNKK